MEAPDLISTAAGGAGGVITMGALAKWLIQNWIKKHEERSEKNTAAIQSVAERTATALEAIKIEIAKISTKLEMLQAVTESVAQYGQTLAVLKHQSEALGASLNGLGQKVKRLEQQS